MARFELAASWSQTKRTTNCTTSRYLRIGFFVLPRISIPCPYRDYLLQYDNNDPKHLRSMSVSPNSEKQTGVFIFSVVAPALDGYLEILRSNWRRSEVSIPIPSLVPLVFKTRLPAGAITPANHINLQAFYMYNVV